VVYESKRAHPGSPAYPAVSVTCEASFIETKLHHTNYDELRSKKYTRSNSCISVRNNG
jgi:hypothetical protein